MAERQSDVRNLCERRSSMRVDATILTDVLQKTRRSGFAWLKNLSKGGGLLRWCATVSDGTRIRLAIRPPGGPAFEVDAEVLDEVDPDFRTTPSLAFSADLNLGGGNEEGKTEPEAV